MKLSKLKPNPANPRLIKDDKFRKLCQSLKDFPQMMELRPIITDENLCVLGGNMRLAALKELGYTELPEGWVKPATSLTEAQKQEFIIKDNIGFGEWDWDIIANSWDTDQLMEWGLDLPDFITNGEATEDDYQIPDEIKTDIVLGDLFQIGQHRLLCGSSVETEDVKRLLNGETIGATVTDPPYNVGVKYTESTNDDQSKEDFTEWCQKWASLASEKKILTVGCQRLVWWDTILGDPQWIIAWVKRNGQGNTNLLGTNKWDAVLLYNVPKDRGIDIIELNNDYTENLKARGFHPTAKPVALYVELIRRFVPSSELIYEPFGGTGTTLLAAHQLNRRCFGMEIDPKYCQVILDRMRKLDPEITINKVMKLEENFEIVK